MYECYYFIDFSWFFINNTKESSNKIPNQENKDGYMSEYSRILLQSKREKIDYQYPIAKTRNSINLESAPNDQAKTVQDYLERRRK